MTTKRRQNTKPTPLAPTHHALSAKHTASLHKRGAVFVKVLADHDHPPLVVWSRRALPDVAKDAFADAQRCLTTAAIHAEHNTVAPIVSPESEFVTDADNNVRPVRAISRRHDARRPLLPVAELARASADQA